jgi:hypothetical protein
MHSFISNRLLMPYLNEAIIALETGVASKEDIDQTMKLGMNHPSSSSFLPATLFLRRSSAATTKLVLMLHLLPLAAVGPLQLADLSVLFFLCTHSVELTTFVLAVSVSTPVSPS